MELAIGAVIEASLLVGVNRDIEQGPPKVFGRSRTGSARHFWLFINIVNYGSKKQKGHSEKEEEAFGQTSSNYTTHLHLVVSNTVK
jgi:hypothetical protein